MKQIYETIEFLQAKMNEVTDNQSFAIVERVTNEDVIVSYQGKRLYAITNKPCKQGDVLVVDGDTKVPVKPENTGMDILEDSLDHNAVIISNVLGGKKGEFIRTLSISMSYLEVL